MKPSCFQALQEVDMKFYLRNTNLRATSATRNIFDVLIDTGCSVACTGFQEDFDGVLIPGEFGQIKTANGEANIQGFGLVKWHTVTDQGESVLIRVPCYYAPDITLRLFSPQDYARYHKMPHSTTTMCGSHSWFGFQHESSEPGKEPKMIVSNINPQSRLFL